MVTSYILGFFFNGVYQFFVLYLMGSIIPMHNKAIKLSRGFGVRNTLELAPVKASIGHDFLIQYSGVTYTCFVLSHYYCSLFIYRMV